MSRNRKFFVLVAGLTLIPAIALGGTPAQAPKPAAKARNVSAYKGKDKTVQSALAKWKAGLAKDAADAALPDHDLTVDELGIFPGFKRPSDNPKVIWKRMFGMVYKECRDKFEFHNPSTQPSLAQPSSLKSLGFVAFRVTDLGGGKDCMEQHKIQGDCDTATDLACTPFSAITETGIRLEGKNDKDVRVCLFVANKEANVDPESSDAAPKCVDFDPANPIVHQSAETRRAIDRAETERTRQILISRSRAIVSAPGCLATASGIVETQQALRQLVALRGLLAGEQETITANIALAQLGLLEREAVQGRFSGLSSLSNRVIGWASTHPEHADAVANVLYKIAFRQRYDKDAGSDGFREAASTLAEAQTLEGLNGAAQAKLAEYQQELKLDQLYTIGQKGLQGNPVFWNSFNRMLMDLDGQARKACMGRNVAQENCAMLISKLNEVRTLPDKIMQQQMAYQQEQQRAQAAYQQQVQQQQQQAQQQQNPNGQQPYPNGMPPQPLNGAYPQTYAPPFSPGGIPPFNPGVVPPFSSPGPNYQTMGTMGIYGAQPPRMI